MEAVDSDIMDHKPKAKGESLFAHGLGLKIGLNGVLLTVTTLTAYLLGFYLTDGSHAAGSTMAFMVLAMSQLVQALNMRSSHSLFKIGFFSNKTMNLSLLVCTVLTAFVLFTPGVVTVFGMMMLDWWLYLVGLGLSILPIIVMEIAKAVGFIKSHSHK
jgi:Ca2+-transporting ATPase